MTSRRSFLTLAVSPYLLRAAGHSTALPPAMVRYSDLATELPVTRLTDPAFSSLLPPAASNPISRRGFLLFSCNASGTWQAYRMDLKSGSAVQLTEAEALDPSSLTQLPGEKSFCYWDKSRLMTTTLEGGNRSSYKVPSGFETGRGVCVSSDGIYTVFVEKRANVYRLRLLSARSSAATTLAEYEDELRDPLIRPHRASVLYRRGGGLYLANFEGKQGYRLRIAEGTAAQATWSPDGRSVLYLNVPGAGKLNTIREFVPDTHEDRLIAETTQFAAFTRNADASVFAGASGSKASPTSCCWHEP